MFIRNYCSNTTVQFRTLTPQIKKYGVGNLQNSYVTADGKYSYH
jgi:hypothetical protein